MSDQTTNDQLGSGLMITMVLIGFLGITTIVGLVYITHRLEQITSGQIQVQCK